MKKQVIINADDFGLCESTNDAIITAFKKGVLTSTSLLTTGAAVDGAIALAKKNKSLGVGIHLSLTWGKALLHPSKIPTLVDGKGYFNKSPFLVGLYALFSKSFCQQVQAEWEAQIEYAVKKGLTLDHLNGQHHIDILPNLFSIAQCLAQKYHIPHIRIPKEPRIKRNKTPSMIAWGKYIVMKILVGNKKSSVTFYGLIDTNNMTEETMNHIIMNIEPGITEIITHPGQLPPHITDDHIQLHRQGIPQYIHLVNRKKEMNALMSTGIKKIISQQKIILTTFGKLHTQKLL